MALISTSQIVRKKTSATVAKRHRALQQVPTFRYCLWGGAGSGWRRCIWNAEPPGWPWKWLPDHCSDLWEWIHLESSVSTKTNRVLSIRKLFFTTCCVCSCWVMREFLAPLDIHNHMTHINMQRFAVIMVIIAIILITTSSSPSWLPSSLSSTQMTMRL